MRAATATVAIPTRNRRALLIPLLERLIARAADLGAEILVVDNGPSFARRAAFRAALMLVPAVERLLRYADGTPPYRRIFAVTPVSV
jgi:hypothetical protein